MKAAHLERAYTPPKPASPAASPLAACKPSAFMPTEEERLFGATSALTQKAKEIGRNLRAMREALATPARQLGQD